MIQSKKIDRYNDDFYLQWSGAESGQVANNLSALNNSDWCISFFANTNTDGGKFNMILDTRVDFNNSDGIYLALKEGVDFNLLELRLAGNQFTFTQLSGVNFDTWTHYVINYDNTAKTLGLILNGVQREVVDVSTWTINFVGDMFIGSIHSYPSLSQFNYEGGLRDLTFYTKVLNTEETFYIYNTGIPPVSSYTNIQHAYPLNQVPYESGGNYFMRDTAKSYNPSATTADVQLVGWTDDELGLGVGGLPSSTTYRGWESKTNYIPTIEYNKGLNMLTSQSLTINGLTIGDKLVVNYDELGVAKQEVIDVNAVNYTYSNIADIKVRLITVLKDGFYANQKVYKTIFNNGILRSGILSSYTEVVNAETNLSTPFDDAGTLKFPDLSVNNRVIVANGWIDLTDLQNSIN